MLKKVAGIAFKLSRMLTTKAINMLVSRSIACVFGLTTYSSESACKCEVMCPVRVPISLGSTLFPWEPALCLWISLAYGDRGCINAGRGVCQSSRSTTPAARPLTLFSLPILTGFAPSRCLPHFRRTVLHPPSLSLDPTSAAVPAAARVELPGANTSLQVLPFW